MGSMMLYKNTLSAGARRAAEVQAVPAGEP
jgi:hypothetical protein